MPQQRTPEEQARVDELHRQSAADYAKAQSEETRVALAEQRAMVRIHAAQAAQAR